MDIRLATPTDAETIAALNVTVQQVHADALPQLFKPPSPETFPASLVRQLLAAPDTAIFLGYVNETPAGHLYAQILRREETALRSAWAHLYIHHIAVQQAYQRHGVGQALIQAVRRFATDHGLATDR